MKKKVIYYAIFLLIIFVYLSIKSANLEYGFSDENTYFYMGKLVAEGNMPYKDFFFSRPPLQLFVLALVFKIFGFNFILLKLLPTLFTIISAFFIFLMMKKFNAVYSFLSVILFMFSYDSLRFSTYNMGVNLAVMFLVIGFYFFFLQKKFFISGIILGLAGLTNFMSLIPFAVILVYLFFRNKKMFLKFLAGFSVTFILVNLVLLLAFGSKYIIPVFKYHFLKPKSAEGRNFDIFYRMIRINFLLFLPALLFFVDKNKRKIGIAALSSGAYLLFFIALNKVFGYYFMFIFPFLAIIGGYSLINLIDRVNVSKKILYSVLFVVVVLLSAFSVRNYINYDYQDFNNAEEISQYVADNSDENEEIFGDDSIVQVIALLSNRRIALNFADSNNLRFRAGVTDINEVINDLKQSGVKFIINYKENLGKLTAIYGPAYMDEFSNYVKSDCSLVKTFSDNWNDRVKVVEIHDCKQ